MHEPSGAPLVAPRNDIDGNRERCGTGIARVGRDHSVCGPRSSSRVCAPWHNGVVACLRRAVSLSSVFTHRNRVRRHNKYGVVVTGAMVGCGHRTRDPAHARGHTLVRPMLPDPAIDSDAWQAPLALARAHHCEH